MSLAAELSDVRNRGIDAIERSNHKQKPLFVPELTEMIESSPWAQNPKEVALRRLVARAILYCGSAETRNALQVLYGIDIYSRMSADERRQEGLKALRVPRIASAEHKKQRIREARLELARAILLAAASGFQPPSPAERDEDLANDERSSTVRVLFAELRALSQDRGLTLSKLDTQAPQLLEMPGVRDEYLRATGIETRAECAVKFLTCTVRMPSMREPHAGRLVFEILNLGQVARNYEYRVDKYIAAATLSNRDEYLRLETRAFERFARLISALERSPCFVEEGQVKQNHEFAEHLFGLLMRLALEDRYETAKHLEHLIREQLPHVASAIPEPSRQAAGAWFAKLLRRYEREYEAWQVQYRTRIDGREKFLRPVLLSRVLLEPLRADQVTSRRGSIVGLYREVLIVDATGDELSEYFGDFDFEEHFRQSRVASLVLFAQMLSYNHSQGYWFEGTQLDQVSDDFEFPTFPIVPISEFLPGSSTSVDIT